MARPQRIVIPLYNHLIFIYHSLDDFPGVENYPEGAAACTWEADANAGISTTIVFKKFTVENVAHEAYHAICDMLKHVGVPLNHENQESVAYPPGYLVEQIILGQAKWAKSKEGK